MSFVIKKNIISRVSIITLLILLSSCNFFLNKKEWHKTREGLLFWGEIQKNKSHSWQGGYIGDLIHGRGTFITYNGQFIESRKKMIANYGTLGYKEFRPSKDGFFLGEENSKSLPDGFGVLINDSLLMYGTFKDGILNDKKSSIYLNNLPFYVGEVKNGQFTGQGVSYNLGKVEYDGEWKKGIYNGYGKLYNSGFLVYDGEWKNGVYDGRGVLFKDSAIWYEGEWAEGLYNGSGTLYEKGNVIKGEWSKGDLKSGLFTDIPNQANRIWKIIIGNRQENIPQNNEHDYSFDSSTIFIDSLLTQLSQLIASQLEENVNNRFGISNMPRMLWQSLFTDDSDRKHYAEKSLSKELLSEDIERWINEKIHYYNSVTNEETLLKSISLQPLKKGEIITSDLFNLIKDREIMEWTDLVFDLVLTFIIVSILSFIIGSIFGGPPVGCVVNIIAGIISLIICYWLVSSHFEEIEGDILQQTTEQYMVYINEQQITIKLLY